MIRAGIHVLGENPWAASILVSVAFALNLFTAAGKKAQQKSIFIFQSASSDAGGACVLLWLIAEY